MNKSALAFAAIACLATLWLSACSSVSMREPLAAATEEGLREALSGTWSNGDGDTFQIAFDDGGGGELAYLERVDDQFQMAKGELAALEHDERVFVSIRMEEDGEEYSFSECLLTDEGNLVIWLPDVERFKQAVDDGELPGSATSDRGTTTVKLTASAADVLAFYKAHPEASETRQPLVVRKTD